MTGCQKNCRNCVKISQILHLCDRKYFKVCKTKPKNLKIERWAIFLQYPNFNRPYLKIGPTQLVPFWWSASHIVLPIVHLIWATYFIFSEMEESKSLWPYWIKIRRKWHFHFHNQPQLKIIIIKTNIIWSQTMPQKSLFLP